MDLLFLMTIVPAYLVGSFFIKHDAGPEEPKKGIHAALGFGIASIVLALVFSFLFNLLISGDILARVSSADSETPLPLFVDVLIFATIEEFVKFIPLAIYILKKDFFNEVTDGIIYFAIVGLTFGAIESFLYGFTAGEFGVIVAIMRLALGLFFHGALTSIAGYYLAKAKVTSRGLPLAFVALIGVSLAHTAYNYFVYSSQNDPIFIFGAAAVALVANAMMFWLYFVALKKDIQLGLAGPQYLAQRQQQEVQRRQAMQQQYVQNQQLQPMAPQPTAQQLPPTQPQPIAPQPQPTPQTQLPPTPLQPPQPQSQPVAQQPVSAPAPQQPQVPPQPQQPESAPQQQPPPQNTPPAV